MEKIGAYSAYQKINEQTANPYVGKITGTAEAAQAKNLYNWEAAGSVELSDKAKELIWGRVILKGKVNPTDETPVARKAGREPVWIGVDSVKRVFSEVPTALELSQKDKNMDRRNVTQRTFSRGGEKLDFTV